MIALMAPAPMVVAYVPNWIDLDAFVPTIDFRRVTHLNVAFANPIDDSGTLSFDPRVTKLVLAAHAKKVKVYLSIGGGSAADDPTLRPRYGQLLSDARRPDFVAKLVAHIVEHRFDGLDVDIEGPSITPDYTPFIAELSRSLRAKKKGLTAALSQGYGGANVTNSTLNRFDWVNVMAYDATGSWAPNEPGPHSSLDYARSGIAYWRGRGLSNAKIVLGVPFYGWGFGKAANRVWSYKEILKAYPEAHAKDTVGDVIWYNGLSTMTAKGRLVREERLAGAMIWSLDNDADGALLRALWTGLDGR